MSRDEKISSRLVSSRPVKICPVGTSRVLNKSLRKKIFAISDLRPVWSRLVSSRDIPTTHPEKLLHIEHFSKNDHFPTSRNSCTRSKIFLQISILGYSFILYFDLIKLQFISQKSKAFPACKKSKFLVDKERGKN